MHVIASGCVWVSVCAHTSRCNMELLLATKEHFDCQFFLVLKKKKRRSPCSIEAHLLLSPPPPSHFIFGFNTFLLLWNQHIVYIQSLLRVVVNRGGLVREPEMEQGLAPTRLWYRNSVQMLLAGRKSWNKFNICKNNKAVCSAFLLQPVWCSAQQKTSWSSQ